MTVCECCGCDCRVQQAVIEWDRLRIRGDELEWSGRELTKPTPAQLRVLVALASRPLASLRLLEIAAGSARKGDAAQETVKNHLTRLRQWLVNNAVPLAIENVRGKGYRLRRLA